MKVSFNDFASEMRSNSELNIDIDGEEVIFPGLFLLPRAQRELVGELAKEFAEGYFVDNSLREDVDEDELILSIQGVLREACSSGNFDRLATVMPEAFLPWFELYGAWMKEVSLGEA